MTILLLDIGCGDKTRFGLRAIRRAIAEHFCSDTSLQKLIKVAKTNLDFCFDVIYSSTATQRHNN